jgi:hypothetical protein
MSYYRDSRTYFDGLATIVGVLEMARKRISYILRQYPQVTESYIESEIRALWSRYDIQIIAINTATDPSREPHPFRYIPQDDEEAVARAVREFQPDVVHGHEMDTVRRLRAAARAADVPFTVRAHSYDVLGGLPGERLRHLAGLTADQACAGVLAFPFTRPALVAAGIPDDKVHDCPAVVDFARFHDVSPNGDAIMNLGSCQPKKNMHDYIRLAARMPGKRFDLYAVGFRIDEIRRLNTDFGEPVRLMPRIEHSKMPAEYKKHEWLVYTASGREKTVGWPVAIGEAQAAGVGVCMQNIRPDLNEYVGDAGFLFDTIDDVEKIISRPFPEELRQRGFEQARRSDIGHHICILEDLWNRC